jgi:hypothetical protein
MKGLQLGFDALGKTLQISSDDRKSHMHVIGSSGSGKSKFMEWMMRGEIRNRQGFALLDPHGTLYDAVADYCAHHIPNQEVVLLNLSQPDSIINFNPFRKSPNGDVSVQVDRRISAILHAWDVKNADQTPTLERMLRLIFTVMLEHNLGLPQIQHLIDFNAGEVREQLIEKLQTPLVQHEWRELQLLKAKEWREETLSAKNRLFRFLTSTALTRFLGLPDRGIDLKQIIDEGKILLVKLAPSDDLSEPNSRVFGSLLINEIFETAMRRKKDEKGNDPAPYFVYLDEFASFVSVDLANMLDQIRKFGIFLVLAHQRFGQIDENIQDAVLTNCKIKAVFGGLPTQSARLMAEELFIGDLDAKKIKAAIYQTKFWAKYARDKVYSKSSSHSESSGYSDGSTDSFATGASFGLTSATGTGEMFAPSAWFDGVTNPTGASASAMEGTSFGNSSMRGESTSHSQSYSESHAESEGEADIPIFIPVPFQELSSVQYYTPEEQLIELTAALKEQYGRHAFIKIQNQKTQPMLVPFVKDFYTSEKNRAWYIEREMKKQQALSCAEVDKLLEKQEQALIKTVKPTSKQTNSKTNVFDNVSDDNDPFGRE